MTAQVDETDAGRADTTRRSITKADWLSAQTCAAMGWFRLRAPPVSPSEADRFRMEQGQEIGCLARKLYPDGTLVTARAGKTAVEITENLISDTNIVTLFEAAFAAGFCCENRVSRLIG